MADNLRERGRALLSGIKAGSCTNDQAIVLLASALVAALGEYPVHARGQATFVAVRGIEQGVAALHNPPARRR